MDIKGWGLSPLKLYKYNMELEIREITGFIIEAGYCITDADAKRLGAVIDGYHKEIKGVVKAIDALELAGLKAANKIKSVHVKEGVISILSRPLITK